MGKTKIECKKLEVLTGDQKCVFCHQTDIDEMKYGPIYMHKNIITHYYCLLLSSNMEQNGRDCDGILGFLPNDIHKEVRRGVRLYCTYCRSGGATLGCAIAKCKVVFHLPCGMKHATLHQFYGEFKSFCAKHRPVQKISGKILAESSKNAMCGICYEKVVPRPIHETLWAPCCQKSAFFHRDCVQRLATSAGYFFKCPLCNNTSTFQKEMKEFGIYIPEQDASWECVPNAYQDLLVRHDTCDSASCNCPSGRKTNNQGTRWELILCKYCGSQGIHIGCGRLKWKSPEFVCDTCTGNNEREDEANARNYQGNRHRLSGTGRTAEIHPSVSADRERERSSPYDDNSSDESEKVALTNRRGRRRVISPPPKIETPPPDTRTHKKSEKHSKRSAPTSSIKEEDSLSKDTVTVIIDDSDDDVEVVGETNGGSCLKTNDGTTIQIVKVRDSVKKRLNVEGDVNVSEEIVDITIHREGPPKKRTPSPPVEEVFYSLPSPTPKPSTSTSYCPPSTSFTVPPPDLTKFVLVDPSTFRPEDLPPGTVLYRSFTPMMPVPQTSAPSQPQVQPMQTTQLPMPQLGGPGGRSADAKHPDLSQHGCRGSFNLNAPAYHAKKTSRSNKHNSARRRGRGCDHDRLNPRVLLSPLKCRISNDGFFEILLPRRNLGIDFGLGSFKRKASPLPSRPAKKMKLSLKDSVAKKKKQSLKRRSPHQQQTPNLSKKKSTQNRTKRKAKDEKQQVSNSDKTVMVGVKKKEESNGSRLITTSQQSDEKRKWKISALKSKTEEEEKENISLERKINLKKKQNKNKFLSIEWKYKKIDEYLNKLNSKSAMESNDLPKTTRLSDEGGESFITVKELMDGIIGLVVQQQLSKELPNTDSENSDVSSLDFLNEIDVSEENDISNVTETDGQHTNSSRDANYCSSPKDCNETINGLENNSSLMSGGLEEGQICEVNCEDANHINKEYAALDLTTDSLKAGKEVNKANNLTKTNETKSSILVSSQIEISVNHFNGRTSNERFSASQVQGRIQEIPQVCNTPTKSTSSTQDLSNDNSRTIDIPSVPKEDFKLCLSNPSPSDTVMQVNVEDNEPQTTSNLNVTKCAIKAYGLFPRIKIKSSKVSCNTDGKTKVLNTLQWERKQSIKGVVDPLKSKRRKIESFGSVCKVGSIEKYFTPILRDHSDSPMKIFGNTTSEINENYARLPSPPANLKGIRFWKTLGQNTDEKGKETTDEPTDTAKSENTILRSFLNNQKSPEKTPLQELMVQTTYAVREIDFSNY